MAEKETLATIKIDEDDIRMGLHFAGEARNASVRAQALNEAENAYIRQLAVKYHVDPEKYYLRDWLTGFEPIPDHG